MPVDQNAASQSPEQRPVTRRQFVSAMGAGAAACLNGNHSQAAEPSDLASTGTSASFQPRGKRRLLYTSDPSNLAFYQCGLQVGFLTDAEAARRDPARAEDLAGWVDELARCEIDTFAQAVFSQGWTLYFRSDAFEYDARPQHQRFVPMLDAGVTPLEVLIEHAHRRGLEFIAKFRMNDRHGGGNQGAKFVLHNPQWQLEEFPGGLDYSFEPVRQYMLAAADEVVGRFDVDGLLFNYMRHVPCFPTDLAPQRKPVMTGFLRSVRQALDRHGRDKQKQLSLGVMVPQTLEECDRLGFDIPQWIKDGLIDYVCPCDVHYADFNAPYDQFAALTWPSSCLLYPTLAPMLCRHDQTTLLQPEQYRALARNFYGGGADGIAVFNYQYHWARRGAVARYPGPLEGYPMALEYLRELKDPQEITGKPRHYRFCPLWGGESPTGAVKNDSVILARQPGATGAYRFRLCEPEPERVRATLYFTAQGLLPEDEIRVEVNGARPAEVRRIFHKDGRLEQFGRPLPAFSTVFFELSPLPLTGLDNELAVTLTAPNPPAEGDVVIDEVDVVVIPC